MTRQLLLTGLLVACSITVADGNEIETLARLQSIVHAGEPASEHFIEKMREQGPAALERLFAMRELIEQSAGRPHNDTRPERINTLIDAVARQRYATESRLFWYTDLAAAQSASQQSGKPILSLRMLGKLTDEYSCANSRFFRIALYANEEVSGFLRDNFVLHWSSERPVPQVTIDFGDGRVMRRTLTGNSIHYVMDDNGRVLDGLPGLYSPGAFLSWLKRVDQLHADAKDWKADDFQQNLAKYHESALAKNAKSLSADFKKLGLPETMVSLALDVPQGLGPPAAEKAVPRAMLKGRLELPLLTSARLARDVNAGVWQSLGGLHPCKLDDNSRELISSLNPLHGMESARKLRLNAEQGIVGSFAANIATDSVKNEYILHRSLHEWFVQGRAKNDFASLNSLVYSKLFLTPRSDPWVGLLTPSVFLALPNNGIGISKAETLVARKRKSKASENSSEAVYVPGQLTDKLLSGELKLEDLPADTLDLVATE